MHNHGRLSATLKAAIMVSVLAPVLYGCGPGFPIMTSAQEELLNDVATLKRDNAELSRRIAAIEGGGGLEELSYSLAETNNRIEELRREFSFVQGSVEAADHDKSQTREDLNFISTSIGELEKRVTGLESAAQASLEGYKAVEDRLGAERERADKEARAAMSGTEERLGAIEHRMLSIEKRLADLESAVSGAKAAAAEDPGDMYERGLKLVKEKDYTGGRELLERFLAKYPSHKLADHAQYWIAEIHYANADWAKAIIEFDKVIKNYPNGDKVAAAMLKQGFSFDKLGSTKEARVLLQAVIDRFPSSNEASLAAKRLETLK